MEQKRRVLIVEDEPLVTMMLEDMLLDAVDDATQKIMKKCFPLMRVDMTKR